MISLEDVSKTYHTQNGPIDVLRGNSFTVNRHERVGILGSNGAGKSTLIRLISGAERPTTGHIRREMSVSWPLAFGGAFQSGLTGLDNLRFICRIYGVDIESRIEFVQQFSELGRYFREPVKHYSSGMRARLSFALSMVVEFECFLIDEIIAVGDARFHEKCHVELFEKRADRSMIIVSHDAYYIKNHCHRAGVLHSGSVKMFDNVDDAYNFYNSVR